MIPQANEDFEDDDDGQQLPPTTFNGAAPRLTPTAIDLVSPFDAAVPRLTPTAIDLVSPFAALPHEPSIEVADDLALPVEPSIEVADDLAIPVDAPTTIVQRDSFRELPSGTIVGENYEVDARLGAGAMGEVYAAHHVRLGKQVAIKVIVQHLSRDDAAIGRFATEARALAQIQHPSIVAVEHVGELPDGRAYFVMEYLRGESLSERLARGRVPLREGLRILDQMARGLEAAHGSGVIHRDLKPDNTFLVHLAGEEPAVKLLDFGLAKLATAGDGVDHRSKRSESGIAIGTPLYMSPEQARGPDVDHRTDVYALGCIAYELVLSTRPFPHARSAPEIYAEHLHGTPTLPRAIWPEIPQQLDLVLFAMLAKDPEQRPTLAQIRSVLTNLRTSTLSQQTPTEIVWPRLPKKKKLRWLRQPRRAAIIAFAIGALATGASVGAAIGTTISSKGSTPPIQPPSIAPTRPPPPIEQAPPPVSTDKSGPSTPQDTNNDECHGPSAPPPTRTRIAEPRSTPRPPPGKTVPPHDIETHTTPAPIDQSQTMNPFAGRPRMKP